MKKAIIADHGVDQDPQPIMAVAKSMDDERGKKDGYNDGYHKS